MALAHPDFEKPFILAVDASFDGIGAVLSQLKHGEKVARPVAFASRTLSKSQLNYPAHRLEFLALKWAVCDKFSHWLKGRHFTAWSDNNPLTYILTKPRLDACEQRWVAKLAAYDFDLKYVPGPKNTVADTLSREPFVRSSISHRLVKEPYLSLLDEINGVVTGTVQDAFRLTTNCQAIQTADDSDVDLSPAQDTCMPSGGTIGAEEVSAVLTLIVLVVSPICLVRTLPHCSYLMKTHPSSFPTASCTTCSNKMQQCAGHSFMFSDIRGQTHMKEQLSRAVYSGC